MSRIYSTHVVPAANTGTAEHVIIQIWNPHATQWCRLIEYGVCFRAGAPTASAGFHFRRSTARGTAGSTVTPTIENDIRRQTAPVSGFLIDLALFSAQPTLATGNLGPSWGFPAVIASGVMMPVPYGLWVPPGTGLCFANIAAIITGTADWSLLVEEP